MLKVIKADVVPSLVTADKYGLAIIITDEVQGKKWLHNGAYSMNQEEEATQAAENLVGKEVPLSMVSPVLEMPASAGWDETI